MHPLDADSEQVAHMEGLTATQFNKFYAEAGASPHAALQLHEANIVKLRSTWSTSHTNQCCLVCIFDKPEHMLECGHSICDNCARTFGRAVAQFEYTFKIQACMLRGSHSKLEICLKPPTAGIRVLCIDGGGVRGVVPLEFLQLLQDALGPLNRLQDLIDLAFGTSSGTFSVIIQTQLLKSLQVV